MKKNLFSRVARSVVGFAILAVMVVLSACSKQDDYCKVIPEDAILVGRLAPAELLDKNGVDVDKLMEVFEVSERDRQDTEKFLKCIDFTRPAYVFADDDLNFGAVAKLGDADALTKFIKECITDRREIEEKKGIKYLTNGRDAFIAFDTEKVLFYFSPERDVEVDDIVELMQQPESESVIRTDLYKQLMDCGKPFAVNMKYADLVKEVVSKMGSNVGQQAAMAMSVSMMSSMMPDRNVLCAFDIDGSKASVTSDLFPNTDEAKKQMDKMWNMFPKLDGKLSGVGLENPWFWMAFSFPSKAIYEQIEEIPMLKKELKKLEKEFDIKKAISSFDGEMSLAVSGNDKDLNILLLADTKNDDYLKLVNKFVGENLGGTTIVDEGKNQFSVAERHYNYWTSEYETKTMAQFGQKDGKFYAYHSEANDDLASRASAKTDALADYKSDIKGNAFFGVVRFDALRDMLATLPNAPQSVINWVGNFKDFTFSANKLHAEFVLNMKSGKKFFEVMFQLKDLIKEEQERQQARYEEMLRGYDDDDYDFDEYDFDEYELDSIEYIEEEE